MAARPDESFDALTRKDVRRIAGPLEDVRVAAPITTGASVEDLRPVLAWAEEATGALADARMPQGGPLADLHGFLIADDPGRARAADRARPWRRRGDRLDGLGAVAHL